MLILTSILIMSGGIAVLTLPALPRDRGARILMQGVGALLFTGGLLGFMYVIVQPGA
jgi:hypothetical protein